MTITMYSKPSCVQCNATYRKLDEAGLEYELVDLTEDPAALEKVKALGHQTAPVVIVSDGDATLDHWGGYRPDKIEALAAA